MPGGHASLRSPRWRRGPCLSKCRTRKRFDATEECSRLFNALLHHETGMGTAWGLRSGNPWGAITTARFPFPAKEGHAQPHIELPKRQGGHRAQAKSQRQKAAEKRRSAPQLRRISSSTQGPTCQAKPLLLIDDDPNTLAIFGACFRLAGHEATVRDNCLARGVGFGKTGAGGGVFVRLEPFGTWSCPGKAGWRSKLRFQESAGVHQRPS